jgi:hypothetical protein
VAGESSAVSFSMTFGDQRLRRAVGHREPEVDQEPLGPRQVRLLELQPRSPAIFTSGFRDRPECSPGIAPVSLCRPLCGSRLAVITALPNVVDVAAVL